MIQYYRPNLVHPPLHIKPLTVCLSKHLRLSFSASALFVAEGQNFYFATRKIAV